MTPMSQALLAIASLFLGVALNEWIRRSNRIESYSAAIFQKRLGIYEELWKKVMAAREVAEDVIRDTTLTAEERHELISVVVLSIAGFCDENNLYVNEEVAVHCCALFMDVEDIQDETNATKREEMISRYRNACVKALEIIREETGLKRINELFRVLTKANYSSDTIQYYRKLQNEYRKSSRE
jgi:hypothetical protein